MHALDVPVSALLREVAATVILPRFRRLAAADIVEKTPGDYVTIADKESEERLTEALPRLLAGSRVVGEEACAADPSLMEGLGEGVLWLVDPIDGTGNFAAGRTPFAVMVALVEDGETVAGWILDPVGGRMCHAARGGGAFVDGVRVRARASGAAPPIAALATVYLPDAVRADILARAEGRLAEVPVPRCAGEQYPRLILGKNDVALFWRAMPWDHAPGALLLEEAGGRMARLDGTRYGVADRRTGLLAAATPALWDEARAILTGAVP